MVDAAGKAGLIDGAATARDLRASVGRRVAALEKQNGITPGLTVILVGESPASEIYVSSKLKFAAEAGMVSRDIRISTETPQGELLAQIHKLNADPAVDGILVQMPLPKQIDPGAVTDAIDPGEGRRRVPSDQYRTARRRTAGLVPCTPLGCIMLLRAARDDLTGLDALVLGRSDIVGKPMALLLLRESCTVTVAHSKTRALPEIVPPRRHRRRRDRQAGIRARRLDQAGRGVIDVGINRVELSRRQEGHRRRCRLREAQRRRRRDHAGSRRRRPDDHCLPVQNTLRAACLQPRRRHAGRG